MSTQSSRLPLIDALKGIASQVVLLHHLALYGPIAAALHHLLPVPAGLMADYGRLAVQVFLVVGGFLAARALSPDGGRLNVSPLSLLGRRYLRLAPPFLIAIGLAIVASALADRWLDDEMIPARATFGQWLAHATLLHGILGQESLSAGVWYVAIDFQLFGLLALLLWAARGRFARPIAVGGLACAALFWFNRQPMFDAWAIYFFGSYGLGVLAWWASDRRRLLSWTGAILCITSAALVLDFRPRIALALGVALLLIAARRSGWLTRWPNSPALGRLGTVSYSVFLIHFPVLLLANATFARWVPDRLPGLGLLFAVAAWAICLIVGHAFHRHVEAASLDRRIGAALRALAQRGRSLLPTRRSRA